MRRGDIEGTLRELERALALEPRNADFRNNHGALLLQAGRTNEAIATLEKGRAVDPGHADLLINLSRAYEAAGRYGDAKDAITLSASIEPRPAAFHMRGRLEERTGDPAAALRSYDRALAGGAYPPALRSRGILLVRIGRAPEGIRDLRAYVAGNPDDTQAALFLRQAEGSP
ncbi:MAG: tetratricopeptide repeat protein, partial [Gemmatimonadetes bacterium]|nr:tetratricopeptide repeat protein [Gemmatimonadota bacterium]